jgi:hypothetical protein
MSWTCPHCGTLQVVTADASSTIISPHAIGQFAEMTQTTSQNRWLGVKSHARRCASPSCRKVAVEIILNTIHTASMTEVERSSFFRTQVYPRPSGKPYPQFVPPPMLEDYQEAWSIIDLSPKSSATLARRCLQAMIRDFCGIKGRTLFAEIQTLEKLLTDDKLPKGVEAETVEAMKALKDVGNIGAHMTEVDGVIVDVEPGEAEALLGLIEMLFADWYVARGKRAERLAAIEAIAAAKKPPAPPVP